MNCLIVFISTLTLASIVMPACPNVRWKRSSPTNAVPEQHAHWTQINIDEAPNYPVISQKIPALHGPNCTGPAE